MDRDPSSTCVSPSSTALWRGHSGGSIPPPRRRMVRIRSLSPRELRTALHALQQTGTGRSGAPRGAPATTKGLSTAAGEPPIEVLA